ncbi:MAG: Fe-S cluster assembly protein SufD [Bacteroidia bacterium]|nr:Fe-S cluster assembly protein SufD [Bacteroidia bacterium]
MNTNSIKDTLISLYNENKNIIYQNATPVINAFREDAINDFIRLGIPTRKWEDYKYTDIEPVFLPDYNTRFTRQAFDFNLNEIFRCDVPKMDTHIILLINGWFPDMQKPLKELENGIIAGSLEVAASEFSSVFKQHFSKYAKTNKSPIAALNTTFAKDGLFLYIPENKVMEKPIQIINILYETEPLMVFPRNLFIIGKHSNAKVVICDHTLSPQKFFSNSVTEISLAENAVFDYYKIQNEHNESSQASSTFIQQDKNTSLLTHFITLHGGFIRNNLYITLNGSGAESNVNGLYLVDKKQHVDNYTFIEHIEQNCTSRQLYKGLIDDEATAVFNGHILVNKNARLTNAYQTNNNILLTDVAKVYTKPQLEIYNDDVKCSHGATIGQLDQDALFYLKSRGISHKEAMTMLMSAFAGDVIGRIRIKPLMEKISDMTDKRLRGEFSRCNQCIIRCC